jgi:acyl dehydratase
MRAPGYDAGVTVTADLEGRVYPDTEPYLVGREKVREFARAVGSTDPLSLDPAAARAAGYADVVAPPTFAVVVQDLTLAQLLADETAGVDFSRVVHGEQRFRLSRPIVAGDTLTAVMTVTGVKTLGGNAMVTSESAIRDETGAHVVTAVSTLVIRGDA